MSGGSWDYLSYKVEEACDRLDNSSCPYRKALGNKLRPIAEALHEIEWVDSGDSGSGQEIASIQKALGGELTAEWQVLQELVQQAHQIHSDLANQLIKIDKLQEK